MEDFKSLNDQIEADRIKAEKRTKRRAELIVWIYRQKERKAILGKWNEQPDKGERHDSGTL